MKKVYIGIDPGKKGGISMTVDGLPGDLHKMPQTMREMALFFEDLRREIEAQGMTAAVIIEKVHSMPGQGVKSMFSFGEGFGAVQLGAHMLGIPVHYVTPSKWKPTMLGVTKGDKGAAVRMCQQIFPSADLMPGRCRVPHDGIAEALLIAEYGRRLGL